MAERVRKRTRFPRKRRLLIGQTITKLVDVRLGEKCWSRGTISEKVKRQNPVVLVNLALAVGTLGHSPASL